MLQQVGGRLGRPASRCQRGRVFQLSRDMLVRHPCTEREMQRPLLRVQHGAGQAQVQLMPLIRRDACVVNGRE